MSEQLQSPEHTSATEFHDQDELNLHAANEQLLSIEAARALVEFTNTIRYAGTEQAPLRPHEQSRIHSDNIARFRAAALAGNDNGVVKPGSRNDYDRAA
jgi:hypothetical protein